MKIDYQTLLSIEPFKLFNKTDELMVVNYETYKSSKLNADDYFEIISSFKSKGTVIDDRGRNLIKSFTVKEVAVNVKSFKIPHLINKFAYKYVRKSKARRSFEYANVLIEKKIGTPQPLAFFEYFTALGLKKSYYFSEHLDYDLTYEDLVRNPEYPDHENILRKFTQFTFKLHEQGIYFKDHSPGNTLIIKNNGQYDFYLIDLNRISFFELDLDDRIKNFARLTKKKELIRIMSDEYASLIHKPSDTIYEQMWRETQNFRKKYERRGRIKKWLLKR